MSVTIFYTLEEIKKNNGKDGNRIWIIYKDGVYDVTDYIENVSLWCFYVCINTCVIIQIRSNGEETKVLVDKRCAFVLEFECSCKQQNFE